MKRFDAEKTPSIQAVAKFAGVSVATVSRTFQAPDRVTVKTRDRLMAAVSQLNYVPDAQARNLRTAKTKVIIVVIVPDITNPFFSVIIRGIEHTAKARGCSVLLSETEHDLDLVQVYGDMVSARQADGLITLLPRIPRIHLPSKGGNPPPIVNAVELVTNPDISSVAIDNYLFFRRH